MPLSVVGLEPANAFYARRVAHTAPTNVLVLGAGDGQVACTLAARGHRVVAVEQSPHMRALLDASRADAHVEGLVRVEASDVRTVRLGEKFDVVLAPANAFGVCHSQDELMACARTVAEHLAPGGLFALDVLAMVDSPFGKPRGAHWMARATDASMRFSPTRLSTSQLDAALEAAGLEARERYGTYFEDPYVETDARQVVVGGEREA